MIQRYNKRCLINEYIFKCKDFYKYIGCYNKQFIFNIVKNNKKAKNPIIKSHYRREGQVNKRMLKRNFINKLGLY